MRVSEFLLLDDTLSKIWMTQLHSINIIFVICNKKSINIYWEKKSISLSQLTVGLRETLWKCRSWRKKHTHTMKDEQFPRYSLFLHLCTKITKKTKTLTDLKIYLFFYAFLECKSAIEFDASSKLNVNFNNKINLTQYHLLGFLVYKCILKSIIIVSAATLLQQKKTLRTCL